MMRGISVAVLASRVLLAATDPNLTEGITAFNEGRYSAALPKLQQAAKEPHGEIAAVFLALTQAGLGDCPAALPELSAPPANIDAKIRRLSELAVLKCFSLTGNDAKAFQTATELEREYPNDPDVLYSVAKLHMKAFNDATFAMFQRTPGSYRVHELSAEIFEVQNRYQEAAAEYRRAIESNPRAPDLHFRLGRALLLQNHDAHSLKSAAAEFEAELKLNPEDGACEFQLGQIAQVESNSSAARTHFARALQLSPNFVQAMISLGKLDTQEKRYAEAIGELERATELQPANEAAHYALLTAYRNSGDMEKAKAEKAKLDTLQKPPEGEFSDFLKKLDAQPPKQ